MLKMKAKKAPPEGGAEVFLDITIDERSSPGGGPVP